MDGLWDAQRFRTALQGVKEAQADTDSSSMIALFDAMRTKLLDESLVVEVDIPFKALLREEMLVGILPALARHTYSVFRESFARLLMGSMSFEVNYDTSAFRTCFASCFALVQDVFHRLSQEDEEWAIGELVESAAATRGELVLLPENCNFIAKILEFALTNTNLKERNPSLFSRGLMQALRCGMGSDLLLQGDTLELVCENSSMYEVVRSISCLENQSPIIPFVLEKRPGLHVYDELLCQNSNQGWDIENYESLVQGLRTKGKKALAEWLASALKNVESNDPAKGYHIFGVIRAVLLLRDGDAVLRMINENGNAEILENLLALIQSSQRQACSSREVAHFCRGDSGNCACWNANSFQGHRGKFGEIVRLRKRDYLMVSPNSWVHTKPEQARDKALLIRARRKPFIYRSYMERTRRKAQQYQTGSQQVQSWKTSANDLKRQLLQVNSDSMSVEDNTMESKCTISLYRDKACTKRIPAPTDAKSWGRIIELKSINAEEIWLRVECDSNAVGSIWIVCDDDENMGSAVVEQFVRDHFRLFHINNTCWDLFTRLLQLTPPRDLYSTTELVQSMWKACCVKEKLTSSELDGLLCLANRFLGLVEMPWFDEFSTRFFSNQVSFVDDDNPEYLSWTGDLTTRGANELFGLAGLLPLSRNVLAKLSLEADNPEAIQLVAADLRFDSSNEILLTLALSWSPETGTAMLDWLLRCCCDSENLEHQLEAAIVLRCLQSCKDETEYLDWIKRNDVLDLLVALALDGLHQRSDVASVMVLRRALSMACMGTVQRCVVHSGLRISGIGTLRKLLSSESVSEREAWYFDSCSTILWCHVTNRNQPTTELEGLRREQVESCRAWKLALAQDNLSRQCLALAMCRHDSTLEAQTCSFGFLEELIVQEKFDRFEKCWQRIIKCQTRIAGESTENCLLLCLLCLARDAQALPTVRDRVLQIIKSCTQEPDLDATVVTFLDFWSTCPANDGLWSTLLSQETLSSIVNNIVKYFERFKTVSATEASERRWERILLQLLPLSVRFSDRSPDSLLCKLFARLGNEQEQNKQRLDLKSACLENVHIMRAVPVVLETWASIVELDLSKNRLGDEGAVTIASWLSSEKYTSLRTVELGRNGIGSQGLANIADALKCNKTLTRLGLSENNLTNGNTDERGILALAETLVWSTTLRILDLSYNEIPRHALLSITRALRYNGVLVGLDLFGTCATQVQLEAVWEKLQMNSSGITKSPHIHRSRTNENRRRSSLDRERAKSTLRILSGWRESDQSSDAHPEHENKEPSMSILDKLTLKGWEEKQADPAIEREEKECELQGRAAIESEIEALNARIAQIKRQEASLPDKLLGN